MLSQAITAALVLIGLALAAITTRAVRQGQLSTRSTRIGAVICGIGLAAMLLSDYPYAGNRFSADHSVLAAILSSLLLVGVVFLGYETQERTEQHRLASSLSGAGLGGIVDHVVDAEQRSLDPALLESVQAPPAQCRDHRRLRRNRR